LMKLFNIFSSLSFLSQFKNQAQNAPLKNLISFAHCPFWGQCKTSQ